MKVWISRWGPAAVIMSVIFIASAIPGSEMPKFGFWDFAVKKGGHMAGYALLALSYLHALNNAPGNRPFRLVAAFCLTVLYAVSDEWHQTFTPGRTPSLLDVIIDGAGGLIGIALWHIIRKRVESRINRPG
jgi:VanZ family protein